MRALMLTAMIALAGICAACTTTGEPSSKASPELAAKYNAQLAANYMREGRMNMARKKLAEGLEQAPHSAAIHNTLARYYMRLGRTQKAEKQYRLSLKYKPDDPQTKNNYGVFLCSHGRPREALHYFVEASENLSYSTPDSALANAGMCAQKIPAPELAKRYFRRTLAINPNQRQALWHLGLMAFKKGRYTRAHGYVSRLIQAHPRVSARVLWVGIETAWIVGKHEEARRLGRTLLNRYPDSAAAGKFIQLVGRMQ